MYLAVVAELVTFMQIVLVVMAVADMVEVEL
jgi:hypothetical protein